MAPRHRKSERAACKIRGMLQTQPTNNDPSQLVCEVNSYSFDSQKVKKIVFVTAKIGTKDAGHLG